MENVMQMRILGGTGMSVSNLCLGAMMFGEIGNTDHDDCIRIVHRALDAGINFIDTADGYSRGESEEIIGKSLKGRRDKVVLATKFFAAMGSDPNERGASRRWIVQEVENSLRRLGTDYIDLYQLHRFDPNTEIDEVLFTLTELVRQGKIRSFGSSSFPADQIVESQWVADRRGYLPFRCEQSGYSIFRRHIERTVLPACQRYKMGMIVFSPLDGGYLSGRYKSKADFTDQSRVVSFSKRFHGGFNSEADDIQRKLLCVAELDKLADEAGIPLAQIAIAWTLEHPAVTSAIIGPRVMEHLETLLDASELRLDTAILDRIDEIVPPGTNLSGWNDSPIGLGAEARRRQR